MDRNSAIPIGIILFMVLIIGSVIAFSNRDADSREDNKTSNQLSNLKEISESSQSNPNMNNKYTSPPENKLDPLKDYQAVIYTSKGKITVDLFEKKTPVTVNNFVFLAKEEFYNNTFFHRIIKNFMIQGGDPTGTGMGGPGYRFNDEEFEGEYVRGTIAMANAGPNTNGSQFFIMHKDTPLPKNYVIFGAIIDNDSLKILDTIADSKVGISSTGEESKPLDKTTIEKVEILEL